MKYPGTRIEVGELTGDIWSEIFGALRGLPSPAIEEERFESLLEVLSQDHNIVELILDIVAGVTARHIGKQIVNTSAIPVEPFPRRIFEDDDD